MQVKEFIFGEKKIQLSSHAENIIRIRVGKEFKPSLFERYGIFRKPDEDNEKLVLTENGVKSGKLCAVYTGDGCIKISDGRFERVFDVNNDKTDEVRAYFDKEQNGLRPTREQVIGDYSQWEEKNADFTKDPKYAKMKTEGEIFYGLGESNEDKLILNGKNYLGRIVYQRNEIYVPFLMTKKGYGILNATTFWHATDVCKKDEKEICWYMPDGDMDFFFFAGDKLSDILERFTYVTGRPILLPKWAYGLSFIEQYKADQFEVMRDAAQFREKKLPCDAISLEPGWMSKQYDFSVDKKWNIERFYICDWMRKGTEPHAMEFTAALKRYGFKLHLWLCCQHDFTAYEEKLAGNDTGSDIPEWFEHLKSFCNDGAVSFKVDPCHVVDCTDETRVYANGKSEPEMHNLMQTLCVKDMYQGSAGHRNARPMHHFCGGYTGMGAYSAATTGDSGGRLKTLAWILNCGFSGVSAITCDMDIHAKHTIHYCFFTGWCQLDSWDGFNHPWWAGDEMEKFFTFYDNLRYRLMPYIYSTSIYGNMTGMPTCRAMPFFCDDKEAENTVYEYMFGDNLLVGSFSDEIYLPKGHKWINYWTGKVTEGGQTIKIEVPEDRGGPLYAKGGAIIPTEKPKLYDDCKNTENIILEVYPEGSSSYDFYEDDGNSLEYKNGSRAVTTFRSDMDGNKLKFTVEDRKGSFTGMTENRTYTLKVFSVNAPEKVTVDGNDVDFDYDGRFAVIELGKGKTAEITF